MTQQEIDPFVTDAVAPGKWQPIVDDIYWARIPLPFRLDHVNVWLLADGDGWAIVDCGIDSPEVRAVWDALLTSLPMKRPIRRIIATHGHTDHVGCAGYLVDRFDIPFQATLVEWLSARLRHAEHQVPQADRTDAFLRKHGCDAAMMQSFSDERRRVSRYLGPQPTVLQRIRNGDVVRIGGRLWSVIVGRGHAEEHASLYCAEEGVLIAGDQILPQITPVVAVFPQEPDADPLGDYLASFEAFSHVAADALVLPGHGLPFRGVRPRIQALKDHHDRRLTALEQAIAQPMTGFQAMMALFKRAAEGGHSRLALGETLAHLHLLAKQGRAVARMHPDGVLRFQAARPATA